MTEKRSEVTRGREKGLAAWGSFFEDGNALYLNYGDGYMTVCLADLYNKEWILMCVKNKSGSLRKATN